jgi:hypothetical protein
MIGNTPRENTEQMGGILIQGKTVTGAIEIGMM